MINLEEWTRKLSMPNEDVELDGNNEEVELWILNAHNINCNSIVIKNAKFLYAIRINGLNLPGYFHFDNCTINELTFDNCNISLDKRYSSGIGLSHTKVNHKLSISRCTITNGRITIDESNIQQLHLLNTEIGGDGIYIGESSCFNLYLNEVKVRSIELQELDITQHPYSNHARIRFEDCRADELLITECKLHSLDLAKLTLADSCWIQKSTIANLSFRQPACPIDLFCDGSTISSSFLVSLEGDAHVSASYTMKAVRIRDCDLGKNARILGGHAKAEINNLDLNGNKESYTSLEIKNVKVDRFRIDYENMIRTLRLINVDFHQLEMSYIQNSGNIYFSSVNPCGDESILRVTHSQTGKWHLHDCSFEKLNYLEVSSSDLEGLRFLSVVWFNPNALIPKEMREAVDFKNKKNKKVSWHKLPKSDERVMEARNRRELYRMLKEASEKQNDRIQALRFQREEMSAYQRELSLTQRFYNPDRIALWAGRSNNHGLNWWRPIFLALVTTLVFYVPIVIGAEASVSWTDIFHSTNAWKQVFHYCGLFPQLLNPIHSLDHMVPHAETIHPFTWYLDYLHRLIMAFFIFQTVAAFRKFIRV